MPKKVNSHRLSLSPKCLNDYKEACVKAQNQYRSQHGVSALARSRRLDDMSQLHADSLADKDSFQHSLNKGVGENLASSWSSNPPDLSDCSSNWYFHK